MIIISNIENNFKTCPYCFGTGTLRAMQSAIYNNTSMRVRDSKVICKHCKGTGLILRREE